MLDDGRGLAVTIRAVTNELGRGAFHLAAIEGQTEVCMYLVEEIKVDINSLSDQGFLILLLKRKILYSRFDLLVRRREFLRAPEFACLNFAFLFQ